MPRLTKLRAPMLVVDSTRRDQLAAWDRLRAALLDRPEPEPMIGGPHEVEGQYRSEPSRDPRQ